MEYQAQFFGQPTPWNKGKLVGQKAQLRVREIWAIRVRLEIYVRVRDLALFTLAIDSKLRGGDLVQLRVNDVCQVGHVAARAIVIQQKRSDLSNSNLPQEPGRALGNGLRPQLSGTATF